MLGKLISRSSLILPVALISAACASSSGDPAGSGGLGTTDPQGGGGGTNVVGSAGAPAMGGTSAGAGGAASGGSTGTSGGTSGVGGTPQAMGGMGGTGSGAGGTQGVGGMAAGGAGGAGAGGATTDPTDYKCTRVVGPSQTNEWYEHEEGGTSYFESLVGSDKWELKAESAAQLWKWADPNEAIWTDDVNGIEIFSPCAGNAPPDRIVAYFVCYQYKNRADWDAGLAAFIKNIKDKYPTVKRIYLFTGNRCNADAACSADAAKSTANTCYVFPYIDEAYAAAAAANPGFVFVGPKFERPCSEFVDPAGSGHLQKGAPQKVIAKSYADFFNGL